MSEDDLTPLELEQFNELLKPLAEAIETHQSQIDIAERTFYDWNLECDPIEGGILLIQAGIERLEEKFFEYVKQMLEKIGSLYCSLRKHVCLDDDLSYIFNCHFSRMKIISKIFTTYESNTVYYPENLSLIRGEEKYDEDENKFYFYTGIALLIQDTEAALTKDFEEILERYGLDKEGEREPVLDQSCQEFEELGLTSKTDTQEQTVEGRA